ncbi:type IV pilus assembly protein FimV [Halomonas sp. BC04]|uniref:type IV pilus assembly protein FimV n=1 Tax=Halomonas sp. BC04 TaxID=1403540 RepID=UPI0003ED76C8|nr:hypothetical protein [Halomonas sp. BC04]EWH01165.1 hypothetical protein Q427_15590 [Halomonas sp. BC04]
MDRQLMLGGAGLAALLGLWLLIRRRRYRETAATQSFASMPSVTYGAPAEPMGAPSTASFTTPPSVAGMSVASAESTVHRPAPMPQAEAISEADIFMAYGRYDQARESLLAGLDREPERDDLRLKLLTVHVEQGDWTSAEREAERLAEGDDPALVAEASRLMAAHRAAASDDDKGRDKAPAAFAAAGELPPQTFDSLLDPQGDEAGERGDVEECGEVDESGNIETQAPLFETVVPSDGEDREAQVGEPEPAPPSNRADKKATDMPSADSGHAGASSTIAWDMIDYQPPILDPEPGRREETPMQPSIDFPTTGSGIGKETEAPADGAREEAAPLGAVPLGESPRMEEEEWEVEEVAFPPLDRDNEGASDTLAGFDELDEARRLLNVGATERAYALLQRLRDSADDPRLQAQAKELITHYRL